MTHHPFYHLEQFITRSIIILFLSCLSLSARDLPGILGSGEAGTFPLVTSGSSATVVFDWSDAKVVEIAANLLVEDIESVTQVAPSIANSLDGISGAAVIAGTLGSSSIIDGLVAEGKIDPTAIQGKWECYQISRVLLPTPDIDEALVITGSDRRGTAYGLLSLSEAMGISPWVWWADVPAPSREAVYVSGATINSQPPSVQYRGIFLNDEDWGLQEWAEKTYESGPGEVKDIGPKTYAKIFELLLRLRANYCWPAMHPSTRAFHYYTDNRQVADDYAIVMGSSHAEAMLRNNVDEWNRYTSQNGYSNNWSYETNAAAIQSYWDVRAQEAAPFENVYTIGKRGIHDSGMVEGSTITEKAAWLNTIIADQRQIISNRINSNAAEVPQIFVPYKEVLEIYESGLVNMPDDVTLVWPDDNHGYIRRLSDSQEQQRAGGAGIYYHLSYWGSPADYLWLSTIPPALIWAEMIKAYDNNSTKLWVFNVGDIKPAEITMEFALRLAWDAQAYDTDAQMQWLNEWAVREFGPNAAGAIASVMNDYFQLNHLRKPEHMDWKDDDSGYASPSNGQFYPLFSHVHHGDELGRLLQNHAELKQRAETIYAALPANQKDAFYQLVSYPVRGAEAMARKFFHSSLAYRAEAQKRKTSSAHSAEAQAAYNSIITDTDYYNNTMSGGKWNEMMDWQPRSQSVFDLPSQPSATGASGRGLGVALEGRLTPVYTGSGATESIELHAVDDAVLTAPMQEALIEGRRCIWTPGTGGNVGPGEGGKAVYTFSIGTTAAYNFTFQVWTPTVNDDSWWIQVDSATPEMWNNLGEGNPVGWRAVTWNSNPITLTQGQHTLTVHQREDGPAISAIQIAPATSTNPKLGEDDLYFNLSLPELNSITKRSTFIDLFNTESGDISWSILSADPWVQFSQSSGTLSDEKRIEVYVDWDNLPAGENLQTTLTVQQGTDTVPISFSVWNPAIPVQVDFVEENGIVAIEVEHPTANIPGADTSWKQVAGMGQGAGVMVVDPTDVPSRTVLADILSQSPKLEYSFHVRSAGTRQADVRLIPAQALNSEHGRRYAIAINDEPPQIVTLSAQSGTGDTWKRSVLRSAIIGSSSHSIDAAGAHTLSIWMVDPGLILDRIELSEGNAPRTYLGARESATGAADQSILTIPPGESWQFEYASLGYSKIINEGILEIRWSDLVLLGDLINYGTLRIIGDEPISVSGNLLNFGLLDVMTGPASLPGNFTNFGTIIDSSLVRIKQMWAQDGALNILMEGYEGHRYQIQESSSLAADSWLPMGDPVIGAGTLLSKEEIQFVVPIDSTRIFFRVEVD